MKQRLPYGDYLWESPAEFTTERILNHHSESDRGYFLEVDIEYPEELHDLHNDYPLLPEVKVGEYSPHMKQLADMLGYKDPRQEKLIPNLNDKKNYIVHIDNLKFALEQGLKLKKVHRVLGFEQKAFMKDYIDLNTRLRSKARDDFEKDVFKLMNNSIFGKTLENVRGYSNMKVCTTAREHQNNVKKPTFKNSYVIENDKLVLVDMNKTSIKFDKPVAVGSTILELSKLLMQKFHYGFMKPMYGEKCKLCFTDTDSFMYHIETEDVYRDFEKYKYGFDFSDYPKDHFLHSNKNKKVVGLPKDEANGKVISEFCGLRPKSYSFIFENEIGELKGKGVPKAVLKKCIRHEDYKKEVLGTTPEEISKSVSFNKISSSKHNVYNEHTSKVGLCSVDDKRWVNSDGITTYSHGHYSIKK